VRAAAVVLLLTAVTAFVPVSAQVDWNTVAQQVQSYYTQVSQAQSEVENGELNSIAAEYQSLVQQLRNTAQSQFGTSVNGSPVYELQVTTPSWTTAVSATQNSSTQWTVTFSLNTSSAFTVYVLEPSDLATVASLDAVSNLTISENVDTTTNTLTLSFQSDATTSNTASLTVKEPAYMLCLDVASYDPTSGVSVTTVGQALGFAQGSQTDQIVVPGQSTQLVQLVFEGSSGDRTMVTVPGGSTLTFQATNGGTIEVLDSSGNVIASVSGTSATVYATVATVTFSGEDNVKNGVTSLASNLGTLGATVQKLYGNVVQVETAEAGWARLVTNLLMFIANLVTALLIAWTVLA